ncbi:MAG: pelota family protein [Thaumarchaeota archaeon]|nr:pelota family protein [Nitrososphaerota archaeon]
MIVTEFNPKHGRCSLIVESSEDLWTLRRLVAKGDTVVTRSSRVMKREEEFSRPDRGERVSITIALRVEEIHLDSSIERLRVRGTIVEASDDSVTKSGSHSVTLTAGHPVTIRKEMWSRVDTQLLRPSNKGSSRFVLVATDRRETGVGTLSGSHLAVLTTIESGLGGKMSHEQDAAPYLSKVVSFIAQIGNEGDSIVVAGPGNLKNTIANQLGRTTRLRAVTIEGFDLTGSDGIRSLVKDPAFQKLASGSVVVAMQKLVGEVVRRVSSGDRKVAYSLPRVKKAAEAGAVESCAVSDDVFASGVGEQELVDVLNSVEQRGGMVYLADSSLEFGKQVSSFGGIVALLRYQLRA